MPYITTTTTPDPANARDHGRVGDPTPGAPSLMGAVRGNWPPLVSSHAVATLEEAREHVARHLPAICVCGEDWNSWVHEAISITQGEGHAARLWHADLPESGGTIGPLPDGTVIEVEQVTLTELAKRVGYIDETDSIDSDEPDILDAYNAR